MPGVVEMVELSEPFCTSQKQKSPHNKNSFQYHRRTAHIHEHIGWDRNVFSMHSTHNSHLRWAKVEVAVVW